MKKRDIIALVVGTLLVYCALSPIAVHYGEHVFHIPRQAPLDRVLVGVLGLAIAGYSILALSTTRARARRYRIRYGSLATLELSIVVLYWSITWPFPEVLQWMGYAGPFPHRLILLQLVVGTLATVLAGRSALALVGGAVQNDVRLMEVAAFCFFAVEVVTASVDTASNPLLVPVSNSNQGIPIWVIQLPLAIVYCASLLRLFLWEWKFETTNTWNSILREGGVLRATLDSTVRLASWVILLSLPGLLGGRTWGPLPSVDHVPVEDRVALPLAVLYGLFIAWDITALTRRHLLDRWRLWVWCGMDVLGCLATVSLWRLYHAARTHNFSPASIMGLTVMLGGIAVVMFGVSVADIIISRYWELLIRKHEARA